MLFTVTTLFKVTIFRNPFLSCIAVIISWLTIYSPLRMGGILDCLVQLRAAPDTWSALCRWWQRDQQVMTSTEVYLSWDCRVIGVCMLNSTIWYRDAVFSFVPGRGWWFSLGESVHSEKDAWVRESAPDALAFTHLRWAFLLHRPPLPLGTLRGPGPRHLLPLLRCGTPPALHMLVPLSFAGLSARPPGTVRMRPASAVTLLTLFFIFLVACISV